MAQQKNKSILLRLISKVQNMLLQLNKNTTKIKSLANITLGNVSNTDFVAKLQQAGVNTGIFNEFKGVLSTAPAGTHQDLDWYINDTDNKLYLWHNNKWNNIGGGATATLDKAALLNLLGLTSISQNQLMDATSTADIAIVKHQHNMRIQAATYTTGTALWLKDDRQGADDTYVGINVIDGVPKISFKKHGESQKDINLQTVYEIAGKTLTRTTWTFGDGSTHDYMVLS